MMISEKEAIIRATIHYYCFNGYIKLMQNAALDGIRLFNMDNRFRLYYAISLFLESRYQDALREFEALQEDQSLRLACLTALIHTHRACKSVDHEEVNKYENILSDKRNQFNEDSYHYAALCFLLFGQHEKAREYAGKMARSGYDIKERSSLMGWIELMSKNSKNSTSKSIGQYFESGSREDDPDSLMGKVKCYEKNGTFRPGIELLNGLIVSCPNFLPALIEKTKLLIALKDWEQAVDTANRALTIDRHCIEAQRHLIMHDLAWLGNDESASNRIVNLIGSFELREPKNANLIHETGKLLKCLAYGKRSILNQAFNLCEKAVLMEPSRVDFLIELGNQCLMMERLVDGRRQFNSVMKMDESNFDAAVGLLHCSILEDAQKSSDQVETMEELQKSTKISKELLYLCALWSKKMGINKSKANQNLEKILEDHLNAMKFQFLGLQFYLNLDPNFTIRTLKLLFDADKTESSIKGQSIEPYIAKSKEMVQLLMSSCPGQSDSLFLMAKILHICDDSRAALCYLDRLDSRGLISVEGLLLRAKILIDQESYQEAANTLENVLAQDFEIRENLSYTRMKAQILEHQGEHDEASKILENLLSSAKRSGPKSNLSRLQNVDILLELARINLIKGQIMEATNILDDLSNQYRGTPEEGRIMIAKAKLYESRGRIEEAISILRGISPKNGSNFLKSRQNMASLYLKHRRDRRLYISCYKEIADQDGNIGSSLMLGDAYMNILEPEKAIEVYEQALKRNPRDGILIRRVGQALIKTHLFEKAVTYYKAALKTSPDYDLRYDLAFLLFRMKRTEEAEGLAKQALDLISKEESHDQDLDIQIWEAKMLHLYSKIMIENNRKDDGIKTLQRTQELYLRVLRRISMERPDSESMIKKASIKASCELAQYLAVYQRDESKSIEVYKKILLHDPENISILTALERLEIARDNLEEARKYSSLILKNAPDDRESLLMTTDLMFRRNDFEGALTHTQHVIDASPCFYPALARLVEAARRLGKLDIAQSYLDKAGNASSRACSETGFQYCRGLILWYRGALNEAIKCFSNARSDSGFGLMATYHMVEIFINPEDGVIGGETFESLNPEFNNLDRIGAQEAAIRTAQKLLNEAHRMAGDDLDYHLMNNFVSLAHGQKTDAEMALGEFIKIFNDPRSKDNVGAILGIASSYLVLRQVQKARTHLKKIMRTEWNYPDAEYLERCWLLLADIYIQSNKYEPAQELLKRVLLYNKSCVKGYKYMGYIFDKCQSHKEAIHNYEIAWKLQDNNNPSIGYKLSMDYMKLKRYVDAIDIARSIVEKYPDFPRIRKDVIDKCRNFLKNC
ncbi:tetratricopeptide repeat protein 21B-like [Brevipalpus obovatus]|uniref:tetratricopeptide repeat protein 21B-like n=1 Tax=Brevipalpus obovatus TaxID=246614 RepID=UPI003D9EA020